VSCELYFDLELEPFLLRMIVVIAHMRDAGEAQQLPVAYYDNKLLPNKSRSWQMLNRTEINSGQYWSGVTVCGSVLATYSRIHH
jgi:hypothetical protein